MLFYIIRSDSTSRLCSCDVLTHCDDWELWHGKTVTRSLKSRPFMVCHYCSKAGALHNRMHQQIANSLKIGSCMYGGLSKSRTFPSFRPSMICDVANAPKRGLKAFTSSISIPPHSYGQRGAMKNIVSFNPTVARPNFDLATSRKEQNVPELHEHRALEQWKLVQIQFAFSK